MGGTTDIAIGGARASTSNPVPVSQPPVPPGGFISNNGANQDSTVAKAAPTVVRAFAMQNTNPSQMRYVRLYDKATPPSSVDTPVARYALAPQGGGISRAQLAEQFVNGLAFRITTGPLDNDTGAASAGDVFINLDFDP